ncbi:MAG TPA: MBL fold metallo-hydrolase [Planctomycetota bacterium]|nr:MBL fold metallo-hydrolase [Planctomycetota bacterium]
MAASAEGVRSSASVVLTRFGSSAIEVFLVQRAPALRFLGGYWALPGGVEGDEDQGFEDPARACALRELFEETGVTTPEVAVKLGDEGRDVARDEALRRDGTARRFVAALREVPQAMERLEDLGVITTPPFGALRYANRFYHFDLPANEWPSVRDGELVDGRFVAPAEALRLWLEDELRIAPPVLLVLDLLARHGPAGFYAAMRAETALLEAGKLHPATFSPGVLVFPLRTETLPPATTTNCYVVGQRRLFVIDPASPYEDEQARLFAKLDELVSEGRELSGVLVTHHHGDHVAAVVPTAERYGVPVFAHGLTLERLPPGSYERRELRDGDRIELGHAPDGAENWTLTAYHSPGHDRGHLAFVESRYRAAIVGDLVSTISTIIIDPPEGHLATYLGSVRRMLALDLEVLYPAHGPATRKAREVLRDYLAHRVDREEQLLAALGLPAESAKDSASRSVEELVKVVYRDIDSALYPYAQRSLLAGLLKLVEEGRVEEVAGCFRRIGR